MGELVHTGGLLTRTGYDASHTVLLPDDLIGRFFLYVTTDALDQLLEASGEGNNLSSLSSIDVTPPLADLVPDILEFHPEDGARFNRVQRLRALAQDEFSRVLTYTFDYSPTPGPAAVAATEATGDDPGWTLIGENTSGIVDWDTRALPDDTYRVRVRVTGELGPFVSQDHSFTVDNTAPEPPELEAEPGEVSIVPFLERRTRGGRTPVPSLQVRDRRRAL